MTEKLEVDNMIKELESDRFDSTDTYSFSIPGFPEEPKDTFQKSRSNQQLVRSILYMGHLIRGDSKSKSRSDGNDFLVDSLEMITSVLDNLYLITKVGIGKNSKFVANLSKHASKVWFVTLLFILKRLISNVIRLIRLKTNIWKEIEKCRLSNNQNVHLTSLIINKYELKIEDLKHDIITESLELLGTLNDLFFVSIEIFGWRVNPLLEKSLGYISAGMSLYRMSRRQS